MFRIVHSLESWSPLLVVLLLAMVTTWLWRVVETNFTPGLHAIAHDPDLIMETFTARQLGDTGLIRYTLRAKKMVHYPDDDTSHFDEVTFTSLEPDAPTLMVRSDHAVRSEKKDEVIFTGNVVVTRNATQDQPLTVIRTSVLTVYPRRGIGKTDQPVSVDYGKETLTAAGMIVNSKTRIAEFTRAKLTHIPPPHP